MNASKGIDGHQSLHGAWDSFLAANFEQTATQVKS